MGKTERKLERNPELVWRDEPDARQSIVEGLEAGEDVAGRGWVIIVDSGTIHQLNLLAGEIWMLCDGTLDETGIGEKLAETFDAPVGEIVEDVREFVNECLEKGWLQIKEA